MKNSKFKSFIKEGMTSYKKASQVAALFRTEIENTLKSVIEQRENWGPFIKNSIKTPQSSKYWTEYPYINSNVEGKFKNETILIRLAINWYGSNTEYPHYSIQIYKGGNYSDEMNLFEWKDEFSFEETLIFKPNPEDLNIERDFNLLIDEFIRFLKQIELKDDI